MKYVISKQAELNRIKHFFDKNDTFSISSLTFFDILLIKNKTPILFKNKPNELRFVKKFNMKYISVYPGFFKNIQIYNQQSSEYSIIRTENQGVLDIRKSFAETSLEKIKQLEESAKENLNTMIENQISDYNHFNDSLDFEDRITKDDVLIIGEPILDKKENKEINQKIFNEIKNIKGRIFYYINQENIIEVNKKKCISEETLEKYNIFEIEDVNINPYKIISKFNKVFVKKSYLGFIALFLKKEVHSFSESFYSGYGLTIDHYKYKNEMVKHTLLEIFTYTHLILPIYSSPLNKKNVSFSKFLIDLIKLKEINQRNDKDFYLFGFSLWKQKHIKRYLKNSLRRNNVQFLTEVTDYDLFEKNAEFIFWGKKPEYEEMIHFANSFNVPCSFMEDGFIRSLSLGSDLTESLSLSFDSKNIYYDYSEASELEDMINNHNCNDETNLKLINKFIETKNINQITKYNTPIIKKKKLIIKNREKYSKVIFIPGQVDNDLSIKYGSVDNMNNLELIKQVREDNPDAYIIYKIHPDILSKNRMGTLSVLQIKKYVNKIVKNYSIFDCFDISDEVHVLTSLVGLDALIYGKKVVCYGIPFYSNWGLTEDKHLLKRRRKNVTLEELVFNVYFKYPRYLNSRYEFSDVMNIMDEIISKKEKNKTPLKTYLLRFIRQILHIMNIIKIK